MYHSLNVATVALVAVVSIALYTIVVSNQVFVVVGLVEVEVEVEVVVDEGDVLASIWGHVQMLDVWVLGLGVIVAVEVEVGVVVDEGDVLA
jgi:hypothetical protein